VATFLRLALAALLIPSVSLAQPERATVTEILVAALRVVRIDSLCHRCHVILVDTEIRGAPHSGGLAVASMPTVDWASSRALPSLDTPRLHYGADSYVNHHPVVADTATLGVEFVPPALTAMDSGEVYVEIDTPDSYGYEAVVRVERRNGKWQANPVVHYREG
jgi:hypothetical protein